MFFFNFAFILGVTLFGYINAAAEAAANVPDWVSYLANGGPFAIVILLIVFDKLSTTGERDRLRAENDALKAEIKDLNENIQSEIVPPLVQMNALMKEVLDELEFKRRMDRRSGQNNDDI